MTGVASCGGVLDDWNWQWDLRAVNGRGLDLRLRIPDWIDGLEQAARSAVQAAVARGNLTLSLKVNRQSVAEEGPSDAAISAALALVARVDALAAEGGHDLAPMHAGDILALVGSAPDDPPDIAAMRAALLKALSDTLIPEFLAARRREGAALREVMVVQLDRIASLTDTAAIQAGDRAEAVRMAVGQGVDRLLGATDAVPSDRLAQELALLAVKSDISEEIDRLRTHTDAARALLDQTGPVGRKLDFLMQEFNREANTLCSKAQDAALTATGLDLKTVIDQMREQVQNVE